VGPSGGGAGAGAARLHCLSVLPRSLAVLSPPTRPIPRPRSNAPLWMEFALLTWDMGDPTRARQLFECGARVPASHQHPPLYEAWARREYEAGHADAAAALARAGEELLRVRQRPAGAPGGGGAAAAQEARDSAAEAAAAAAADALAAVEAALQAVADAVAAARRGGGRRGGGRRLRDGGAEAEAAAAAAAVADGDALPGYEEPGPATGAPGAASPAPPPPPAAAPDAGGDAPQQRRRRGRPRKAPAGESLG
jgi:hypothetical protein